MDAIGLAPVDLNDLRNRLAEMSDAELTQFGKDCRFMMSPKINMGQLPRPEFRLQLKEARDEWRRRHPKPASPSSP